jgi:cell division protein FtsQ
MAPVAAATDKRFRRAHVKPSRKRAVGARQAWLAIRLAGVLALAAYGGWRGVALVAESQALQVGHLVVRGHQRLAAGEVLALVDGLRGQNILTVRLDGWRERLLSSPWVQDATLRRVLPSTVEIVVRERTPMGVGRLGEALYLIDVTGTVVDEYGPAYADIDLPVIDGLAAAPRDGGPLVDPSRAELAARVMASVATRPEIARQVSQVDVSDLHNAVVILEGDTALLRLGDTEFVERLQQYLDLAPALRERMAGIDYVDLRFDERLYVRPQKQPAVVAQASRR